MYIEVSDVVSFSGNTSVVIDHRDAYDISYSLHTSAGTSDIYTFQGSNWTGRLLVHGDPPAVTWTSIQSFIPSATTIFHPPNGLRYGRFFSDDTKATFVVSYQKITR